MRTDRRSHAKAIAAAQALGPAFVQLAESARKDPAVFCQFVLKDESDGSPVELAPMHEEWHDILNNHPRVVLWTHTEAGKTAGISIGRVLWEIGQNSSIRILILSSAAAGAKKIVKALKSYIEYSPELRMVFPHLVPDKSGTTGLWTAAAFTVKRPTTGAKDPTVQACGYNGAILGSRYDLIIVDDYLTAANTYSEHQRNKYYSWLKSTIEGRRTARGRLWFVGNAWHLDDAMHRYAAEPATFSCKYPVLDGDGNSSWPALWPTWRIHQEIINRGPIESRRSLFCDPVADADRRFKLDYVLMALELGDGLEPAWALETVPSGYRTITGVDVAATKKKSGNESAIVTIANRERDQMRQILDITAGRFSGPQIVDAIIDINHRYNSLVVVESNGVQRWLKQFVNDKTAIPVRAFYTGRNKYDPAFGVESLAIEFSAGKWMIPNHGGRAASVNARMHPEIRKLIDEMMRYDPASHTGDRLMATWLAREGVRMGATPAGFGKRKRRT